MLYDTASSVSPGEAIVEIGSHHGRSTVVIASAVSNATEVVAVDPYESARWGGGQDALSIFQKNLAEHGVSDRVRLTRAYGAGAGREWQGGPVGMLFVDGAHDYATVDSDLRAWLPHLSPTAVVLMHDAYSAPGVTRAAFAHMFGSRAFAYIGSSRTLVAFRKRDLSTAERVASSVRMAGRLPYLARNLSIKIALRRGWDPVLPLLGHRMSCFPY